MHPQHLILHFYVFEDEYIGFPDQSVGKESACDAGDPGSIPESGRSAGDRLPTEVFLGFPCGSAGKEFACNVEGLGLILGLERSPGEGKGILAWRIPQAVQFMGHKELDMTK